MRVPVALAEAFGQEYQDFLADCAHRYGLLPSPEDLKNKRFLSRSVAPHVESLSKLFNRIEGDPGDRNYWREAANPKNLRLAYFVTFMPCNLYRVASVWAELHRLGFRFPEGFTGNAPFRAIELGAGPAAGAAGVAFGESLASLGLPASVEWALVERDLAALKLGESWLGDVTLRQKLPDWQVRAFHRRVERKSGLLPKNAPEFHLFLTSFFLNELDGTPAELATCLAETWERHLAEEGLVILVEPALKLQSRRLLEIRKHLLERWEGSDRFKVLLPCLGHQSCGALAKEDDWCHEQSDWWRPPYLRIIDEMTGLDRRTLPFSYLVIARSRKSHRELLPGLGSDAKETLHRLVSPSHKEGKDREFFVCGADGKRRARYRPGKEEEDPARGDILVGAELQGAPEASRVQKLKRRL